MAQSFYQFVVANGLTGGDIFVGMMLSMVAMASIAAAVTNFAR